jgi:hypothetical protein
MSCIFLLIDFVNFLYEIRKLECLKGTFLSESTVVFVITSNR